MQPLSLPPLPPTNIPWEGLHVVIVHCPIALLLTAPLFVLLGLIFAPRWQGFAVSAVLLLILGTAGAFLATATGEAARDIVEKAPDEAFDVMEEHEEGAILARNIYVGITVAYALFVLLTLTVKSIGKALVRIPISVVFLVVMGVASLYLLHAAHLGGRLVHEYGIKARLAPAKPEQKAQPADKETRPPSAQQPTSPEKSEPKSESESAAEGQPETEKPVQEENNTQQ